MDQRYVYCRVYAHEELSLELVRYDAAPASYRETIHPCNFGGSHAAEFFEGLLQAEESPQLTDQGTPCFSKTKRLF